MISSNDSEILIGYDPRFRRLVEARHHDHETLVEESPMARSSVKASISPSIRSPKLPADYWPWVAVMLGLLLTAMLLIEPVEAPRVWFDEGINLSVARNWSETGFYGQFKNGSPAAPDLLSTGMPVIFPIALSFRLLGVGPWQGRLPGALFVVLALGLSYYLGCRLYNQKTGLVTVAVQLLFSATNLFLHPVLLGRQALGELPALAYLLAGYACLSGMSRRSRLLLPLGAIFWGLGVASKPQFLPFVVVSLLFPLLLLALRRDRRWLLLALSLGGALCTYAFVSWLPSLFDAGQLQAGDQAQSIMTGLRTKLDLILVLDAGLRLSTLKQLLQIAPPALLGLTYAAWCYITRRDPVDDRALVRIALWTLVVSWLLWWVALSIGWLRYLFPALFLSGIFVAALLHDLTHGFSLPTRSDRSRPWVWVRWAVGVAIAIGLLWQAVPPTLRTIEDTYVRERDDSLFGLVRYLNAQTPLGSRIETFDIELFFLLNRPYHYPSTEVQDQLNRRSFLGKDVQISYDPLAADPDYLVVGPQSKMWHLYDPALKSGCFVPVLKFGIYDLYQRAPCR